MKKCAPKKMKYYTGGPADPVTKKIEAQVVAKPKPVVDDSFNLTSVFQTATNLATAGLASVPGVREAGQLINSWLPTNENQSKATLVPTKYISTKYNTGGTYQPVGLPVDPAQIREQKKIKREQESGSFWRGLSNVVGTVAPFVAGPIGGLFSKANQFQQLGGPDINMPQPTRDNLYNDPYAGDTAFAATGGPLDPLRRFAKVYRDSGRPKIEQLDGRSYYNPENNTMYLGDKTHYIDELAHAYQANTLDSLRSNRDVPLAKGMLTNKRDLFDRKSKDAAEIADEFYNAKKYVELDRKSGSDYPTGFANTIPSDDFKFIPNEIIYNRIIDPTEYIKYGTAEHSAHSVIAPQMRRFIAKGYNSGGDLSLSSSAFQVQGNPNTTDGNYYPNLNAKLDHNEVVSSTPTGNPFIFSDDLKLQGKPISYMAKKLERSKGKAEKILSANPYDEQAKNTITFAEKGLSTLAAKQEELATAMGHRNPDGSTKQPGQYRTGGVMRYQSGGPGQGFIDMKDGHFYNPTTKEVVYNLEGQYIPVIEGKEDLIAQYSKQSTKTSTTNGPSNYQLIGDKSSGLYFDPQTQSVLIRDQDTGKYTKADPAFAQQTLAEWATYSNNGPATFNTVNNAQVSGSFMPRTTTPNRIDTVPYTTKDIARLFPRGQRPEQPPVNTLPGYLDAQ